jgi:hypothetical protein
MDLRNSRYQRQTRDGREQQDVIHARLHREDQPLHFQGFPIEHHINTRDERR